MPRTSLTPIAAPGSYPTVSANSLDAALTAADTGNKNQFTASGNDLILAFNSGATPYTVTVTSVADPCNRTQDISAYSLGASELMVIGPMKLAGWCQTDGKIYLEANNAAVKFAILAL